jgi:hypothetical protein
MLFILKRFKQDLCRIPQGPQADAVDSWLDQLIKEKCPGYSEHLRLVPVGEFPSAEVVGIPNFYDDCVCSDKSSWDKRDLHLPGRMPWWVSRRLKLWGWAGDWREQRNMHVFGQTIGEGVDLQRGLRMPNR